MTSELLAMMEYFEREKGIDRSMMVSALEDALVSAAKKSIGPARDLRVKIDPNKGKVQVFSTLVAVEKVVQPWDEVQLDQARKIKPDAEFGDDITVEITPKNFGRIGAQTAKQAIMQRLRYAEKAMMYEEFRDRAGDIVSGTIRRFDKKNVMVDLGKFEAIMPANERVAGEEYNIGDRIQVYVLAVQNEAGNPEIVLSRSHPNFVRRLFESEVSEIADRSVEIRSIAREAGSRTKIAVDSADENIDPVGACVGMRGARVKNIVKELNNEKVDIIRWSDNIRDMVVEALKPASVREVRVDEEKKVVYVSVPEEELPKAIGRRGQNVRLTSRLLDWDVEVSKDETEHEIFESRLNENAVILAQQLDVEEAVAEALVHEGFTALEVFMGMEVEDLIGAVPSLEQETAEHIIQRLALIESGEVELSNVSENE